MSTTPSALRRSERRDLARRMLAFYRESPRYFEEVDRIAGERPSAEELVLFQALARLQRGPSRPRILELGAGRCESAHKLIELLDASEYHAVEASPDAVEVARRRHPEYRVQVGDISQLPFGDGELDVVFSNYVLEHTCEPDLVLSEAVRVLRPGGLLGLIVPVCDLPWMLPASLRHRRGDPLFLTRLAAQRWLHLLRVRYLHGYFEFPLVTDPVVLSHPGLPFEPDDDQVYAGSTLEITRFLEHRGCEVVFREGRDITTYVRNGRRPAVDWARTAAFLALRLSLLRLPATAYTTTVLLVVRKR